jgi:von Willebrand factor type D domain
MLPPPLMTTMMIFLLWYITVVSASLCGTALDHDGLSCVVLCWTGLYCVVSCLNVYCAVPCVCMVAIAFAPNSCRTVVVLLANTSNLATRVYIHHFERILTLTLTCALVPVHLSLFLSCFALFVFLCSMLCSVLLCSALLCCTLFRSYPSSFSPLLSPPLLFLFLLFLQCTNVIRNGQFQSPSLAPWIDNSNTMCDVIRNTGTMVTPTSDPDFQVLLSPIDDGADAATVPMQGNDSEPHCDLAQSVAYFTGATNQILYARLSWVDRITSQGNRFQSEEQYAKLKVWVRDNYEGVNYTVFETTNANTATNKVRTFQRIADITSMLEGMISTDGYLNLKIILAQEAVNWPLYFQLDNVELWVCTAQMPPDPRVEGDPHLTTWKGQKYTFNGACDLVLLHSDSAADGLGMDIHLRTKHRRDFSYVTSAAVRIGAEILEVSGAGYYLNGVEGANLAAGFAGYPVAYHHVSDKQSTYIVDMGEDGKVVVKTWKDFVTVKIEKGSSEFFGDSVGMLGNYFTGDMIARDGVTNLSHDVDTFGREWMVLPHEPILFQSLTTTSECLMPPPLTEKRRRLGASITEEMAAKACDHVEAEDREFCIYDVMSTNNVDIAGAY